MNCLILCLCVYVFTGANSCLQLARAMLHLESLIMVDRLSASFLSNRSHWRDNLLTLSTRSGGPGHGDIEQGGFTSSQEADQFLGVQTAVRELSGSIRPIPSTLLLSRSVFTVILSRRLPVELAWEIFSYCVDGRHVKTLLHDILEVKPWMHDSKQLLDTVFKNNQLLFENLNAVGGDIRKLRFQLESISARP